MVKILSAKSNKRSVLTWDDASPLIEPLLANLTTIVRQDPKNQYAWMYLG